MLWAWAFLRERTFTTLETELKSETLRKLLSWGRKKTCPHPSSDAILIEWKHYCEVSEMSLRQCQYLFATYSPYSAALQICLHQLSRSEQPI